MPSGLSRKAAIGHALLVRRTVKQPAQWPARPGRGRQDAGARSWVLPMKMSGETPITSRTEGEHSAHAAQINSAHRIGNIVRQQNRPAVCRLRVASIIRIRARQGSRPRAARSGKLAAMKACKQVQLGQSRRPSGRDRAGTPQVMIPRQLSAKHGDIASPYRGCRAGSVGQRLSAGSGKISG